MLVFDFLMDTWLQQLGTLLLIFFGQAHGFKTTFTQSSCFSLKIL